MPTATLVRRTLVGVVAGAAATAAIAGVRLAADGSPSSPTTTAPAGVQVLQVEQYCRRQFVNFVAAFPDTPSAQGWVCQYLKGDELQTKSLGQRDMDAACRFQLADDRSRAMALDQRDPHSWRCTDPALES